MFRFGFCCFSRRIRNKYGSESAIDFGYLDSLQYDFRIIEAATNKFSEDNKIGEGGFGVVYKGTLENGQEIAVKRFSRKSSQSVQGFKNEVEVLARVRHRNLVTLLGFSVEGEERILVYEYVPNKSLDHFLFGPEKKKQLDWAEHYKIVKGIAQGIQYLHEESRLKIIHHDIKANNILLDNDMNPKISDFGLAIIFTFDQTEGRCDFACGTLGYIAPEHFRAHHISVKVDVYGFGALLLEIISGKRVISRENNDYLHLSRYAWKLWEEGEPLKLLDPTISESCNPSEVRRCIHIALLCLQDDPADRPSMSSILVMLQNYTMILPTPSEPVSYRPEPNVSYIDSATVEVSSCDTELSHPN